MLKKIKRLIKRVLFSKYFRATFIYTKYYERQKIKENQIIYQSYDGTSISGNVFYMFKEMYNDNFYDNYKKYIVSNQNQIRNIKKFLRNKNLIKNVKVVVFHSRKYCKLLATSKYLINNSTFPSYYIKKEGQVYINTWHGTPLKAMGRNIKNSPNELGNTQRNFMMADYLIYQNEFMFNKMREDYMLDNFYKGKYLISGYPRNDIYYNDDSRTKIRKELEIDDKKVLVYMPTWRGSLVSKENVIQLHYLMYLLLKLDNSTKDDTIIYVKLHNYASSMINFNEFKNIRKFPDNYETYEFLNIADALITDYSSVFFDYANTKRKIILFAYDKKEYLKNRGLYIKYDNLPFKIVETMEELQKEIEDLKEYEQYEDFYNSFCNYDSPNTAKQLCDYIFKNKEPENIKILDGSSFKNNKENVLIFGGALLKNGITTALKGIFENIDLANRNYILTFYKSKVEKNKQEINFFNNVDYIPMQGRKDSTILEYIGNIMYFNLNINTKFTRNMVNRVFKREIIRLFPNIKIDYAIHFSGYERNVMHLFKNMDAKKMIYVHNDFLKEEKTKGNFHKNSLIEAYKKFDKIVLVRESQVENIKTYLTDEKEKQKVAVAHNFNNIDIILQNKDKNIEFDHETYCNIELSQLKKILNDKSSKKFINIARFSEEKGQARLINAFNKIQINNPKNYLIIIGGYGKQFKEIKELVESLKNKNIIIIRDIRNPYPILGKCDCFVLSSYYEGLPMTIMEALILDKKVISTDIEGPREFLGKGYGYLVKNSEEGIYEGMNDFINGNLEKIKKFNAEEFNKNALNEFENLFN